MERDLPLTHTPRKPGAAARIGAAFLAFALTASAIASECYEATIVTPRPFMGNNGEIFKLSDGTVWEVQYEYEYLYAYSPDVIVCPGRGKVAVEGKTLNVKQIGGTRRSGPVAGQTPDAVIETTIAGEFQGWSGETMFKLSNGQIWQQSTYAYMYMYAFMPRVMIIRTSRGYEMQVEGTNDRIGVTRVR